MHGTMSTQKYGLNYLKSYSGTLKLAEEALNIVLIIFGALCGYTLKTYLINIIAIYAFITTGIFLVLHLRLIPKKNEIPWAWIECANALLLVILYTAASTILVSELTKAFIVTAVTGFIAVMVYVLEIIDTYKLAITPRARYVWTTPNMPE